MITINRLSEAFGWTWAIIADHPWQSAIVVAIAALICSLASRSPARIRYRIWLFAAAKLAVPSLALAIVFLAVRAVAIPGLAPSPGTAAQAAGQLVPQLAEPFQTLADSPTASSATQGWIYTCLSLAWLMGFVLTPGNWLQRRRQFSRLISAAVPAPDPSLIDVLANARTAAGVNRDVTLVVSHVFEPGVWGVRRPVILFPARTVDQLKGDELEAVLMHELLHIQRRDNLVGNLTMVLYSLLWFFPSDVAGRQEAFTRARASL